MQHGDIKFFIMTDQHTEATFPLKKRGTLTEPLKLTWPHYIFCETPGYHGNPVEGYWTRLYFSTHTEIYCDEHKSNYAFVRFT